MHLLDGEIGDKDLLEDIEIEEIGVKKICIDEGDALVCALEKFSLTS